MGLELQGVLAGGGEARHRARYEQQPMADADHHEGGQREDHAEHAAQRRKLGDTQVAGHQQHREAGAEQQAPGQHGEQEAQESVRGRAPQPVEADEKGNPGLARPALRFVHGASLAVGRGIRPPPSDDNLGRPPSKASTGLSHRRPSASHDSNHG
jgi:hypothetical protein